jgi:hypothetical protein
MKDVGRVAVLLITAFALTAAGCGGDGGSDSTTAATTGAPAAGVSDADVAAGLGKMVTVAAETAAKTVVDGDSGKRASEGLEPSWSPIEDVVKANEPDTYVDIEDAMALLESGDATKAADGAGRLAAAVTGYVAKHPG